jgi:hypothetical protein
LAAAERLTLLVKHLYLTPQALVHLLVELLLQVVDKVLLLPLLVHLAVLVVEETLPLRLVALGFPGKETLAVPG